MSAESKDLTLRLELEPPNEILQKKALIELRETPTNIENGLKKLKALLEAEKDLIEFNPNDEWLLAFLRSCKFYPESARDAVKRFYNIRRKYSEVTNMLLPSKLKSVFEANIASILPQRDQHGRRIMVILSGCQWDINAISRDELFASSVLCTDLVHYEPATQINGVVYILDLAGLTFSHALKFTPYATKRALDFLQLSGALRVKGLHIINQPRIFQPIFAAVETFFSAKLSERILMHGSNYESLHRYIAPEYLPKCYGGTMETKLMFGPESYQLLAKHEDKFIELQTYGMKNRK